MQGAKGGVLSMLEAVQSAADVGRFHQTKPKALGNCEDKLNPFYAQLI